MTQPRRDAMEPSGTGGRFSRRVPAEGGRAVPGEPAGPDQWSRRAIISVLTEVVPEQAESLTILGGHAVSLRCEPVTASSFLMPTADGDFSVTPFHVQDEPGLAQAFEAAGFERRDRSRPGLWGRGRVGGETRPDWNEKVDLLCAGALSGNARPGRRSVAALSRHGKQAVGLADGIELATVDRGLMTVRDLADPARSVNAYVAGTSSLVVAKAFKIGERASANPSRLREKDFTDLYALMQVVTAGEVSHTIARHSRDGTIGEAVRLGRTHLAAVLTMPVCVQLWASSLDGLVPENESRPLLDEWRDHFPSARHGSAGSQQ